MAIPMLVASLAAGSAPASANEEFLASVGRMDWSTTPNAYGASGRRAALEPDVSADESVAKPKRKKRVASLGPTNLPTPDEKPAKKKRSVAAGSGGGITWSASASCLNSQLRSVLASLATSYGALRVNSTCRSSRRNARVGGASKSYHLTGNAADFRVFGNIGAVYAYLRGNSSVGGIKHYGGGLFHIDTGPRRSW